MPNPYLTENEIAAANTVTLNYLNAQGQPKFVWPASFAKARAYVDQLERSSGLSAADIDDIRKNLHDAENGSARQRGRALTSLASNIASKAGSSSDRAKVEMLADAVRELVSN